MQARLKEFSEENSIEIFADVRESPDIIQALKDKGAEVTVQQLQLGDFLVSNRILVERKTAHDFEASVVDGRLFDQAARLKESPYEKPIIIIEGPLEAERIALRAMLGAISSLMLDFNIQLLFTRNQQQTAEFIFALAKREQVSEKRPIRLLEKRKAHTLEHQQLRVLESFPSIGPKMAKSLLAHFKSLSAVFRANEKRLAKVIGKAKAKKMRDVLAFS